MLLLGSEYEIKHTNLLEKILEKVNEREVTKDSAKVINPILFDKDEEGKMQEEKTEENSFEETIVDHNANMTFTKNLLQIVVNELSTSSNQISRLIDNVSNSKTDMEKRLQLNTIKNNLETDIQSIILKAKKEIPELGRILEEQERKIYTQVEEILQEGKQLKENRNNKEEFRSRIKQGVNVDEKLALENVERKSNENTMELPGNVIE